MVELDANTIVESGVTFVQATVTNTRGTRQVIAIESHLDGPVWSPNHGRRVVVEWDGDRWEGVLQPGERRGVGFATPAVPIDQPVTVANVRRATSEDLGTDPRAVLRDLDEWRPPRAVLGNQR